MYKYAFKFIFKKKRTKFSYFTKITSIYSYCKIFHNDLDWTKPFTKNKNKNKKVKKNNKNKNKRSFVFVGNIRTSVS